MEDVTLDPLTLTDVPTARDYLKVETTDLDEAITALVNWASFQIEMHTRRRLLARAYDSAIATAGSQPTLVLSGRGSNRLRMPEWPVNSVTSILHRYEDGVTTRALNITGLRILPGAELWIPYDSFPCGPQNLEVKCNLGYATAHLRERRALESACLRWVQVMWADRDHSVGRGGSFSAGGESVTLIPEAMPKDVTAALAPFVRLV